MISSTIRSFHQNLKACKVPIPQAAAVQQKTPAVDVSSLIIPPKNQEPLPDDYVLFYRNPKANFFKFATIASLLNALTLAILAYFTMTMVKFDSEGNRTLPSLTEKLLIATGYGLAAIGVIAGIAYYARHNILEMGRIDEKTVRIVTAKFGWNNYKDMRVPIDHINIPQNSMENLKYNLFLTEEVAKTQTESQMKNLKRKGDYVFLGLKGRRWNHLMDVTADSIYVDKHNFLKFLEQNPRVVASSVSRSASGYNPYKK